jgi:hypothetical protein
MIYSRFEINLLTFLGLLAAPLFAGENSPARLQAFAEVSLAKPDDDLQLHTAAGFGGGVLYFVTPGVGIAVEAHSTKTHREFDIIAGTGRIQLLLNTLSINFHYRAWQFFRNTFVSFAGGIGVLRITQQAYEVSLGALGTVNIPQDHSTSIQYNLGAIFSQNISSRLAIRLAPQVQFADVSGKQTNFYVKGGIGVGIL